MEEFQKTVVFKNILLKHFDTPSQNQAQASNLKADEISSDEEDEKDKKTPEEKELEKAQKNNKPCLSDHSKELNIYEKTNIEKFELVEFFKNKGDQSFNKKDYEEAKDNYSRSLTYLIYLIPKEKIEFVKYTDLEIKINLNLGQVRILRGEFRKALKKNLHFVLSKQGNNVKALYRKAKCHLSLDEDVLFLETIEKLKTVWGDSFEAECGALYKEYLNKKNKFEKWK